MVFAEVLCFCVWGLILIFVDTAEPLVCFLLDFFPLRILIVSTVHVEKGEWGGVYMKLMQVPV